MYCFIPAAGYGKRMGDLTKEIPKPLLKIGSLTFLENTIELVKSWGITKFVINTHYLANQFHAVVDKLEGVEIIISHEKQKILGTAGGIKKAFSGLLSEDDYFICINPDIIYKTNINIYNKYKNFNGKALLFLYEKNKDDHYTGLSLKNNMVKFDNGNFLFTGLSILKFSILKAVPLDDYFDLADIFRDLAENDNLIGEIFPGEYLDLGDSQKYYEYVKTINH